MIFFDQNSSRSDLEVAAIEAGMCDDERGCERVAKMNDHDLYEELMNWMEMFNEAAP
ncbi:MAG: hypothetical protein KGS10_04525 [Chloroflexi bacterium]|nr:hypothetical protein [Chloroflexota bacterium]